MATSRVSAVIEALVSRWSADATLSGLVWDGPRLDLADAPAFIVVGHDGSSDPSGPAATAQSERVGIGTNNRRDERIDVTCAVSVHYGDNYPNAAKLARDRAYVLLAAAETAVETDLTLGVGTQGTPGSLRNTIFTDAELFQSNDAAGCRARLVFAVSTIARL